MSIFTQRLSAGLAPIVLVSAIAAPTPAAAMGKAPASVATGPVAAPTSAVAGPTCGMGSSAGTSAHPVRAVVLRPVDTKIFQLPNGATVDLKADLNSMLMTAVAATSTFSPSDAPASASACDSHVELRATVSSLELNVFEAGITFGFSPTGTKAVGASLQASADVQVGTIAMDLSLWDCNGTACTAVAATTADSATTHVTTAFTVNFGLITTGPQFIYNTPLGEALRGVMKAGVNSLAASPRVDDLPWSATVHDVSAAAGTLTFDAGTRSRIAANQRFTVYAADPGVGACPLYKTVAYVHATDVNAVSSAAVIDQSLDARGIKVGDLVMVRPAGSAQ